jgi:hypothetical protein
MDWIIKSKDDITGLTGENRYTVETGFLTALGGLLSDPKKQFISATLPDGTVLDAAAAKALLGGGFGIGEGVIGETPI